MQRPELVNSSRQGNPFKTALLNRSVQIGIWSASCSNILAEMIGGCQFDWVLFDTEHAPNTITSLIGQLQALQDTATQPVVRPAANDPVLIKQVLDIGFRNILVPFVETEEEARRAVQSTRYPPLGIRGVSASHRGNRYGRDATYFERINREIAVLAQIESTAGVRAMERIGRTDGIDGIFVGPGDLAASLGRLGNPQHADVQALIKEIGTKASGAGITAGIVATNPTDAERYLGWGFTLVTVCSDTGLFQQGLQSAASAAASIAAKYNHLR